MPRYVYEAANEDKSCANCRGGFEVTQSIHDQKISRCPACGNEVFRVIQSPGLGRSKTDLHYRAKRAGFSCLRKSSKGEYEKIY